jgi:DNA-binding Lrp family transcriptional regulator
MPTAYVLINCDLYHKSEVVKEISRLPGISESAELDAIYDILVKLNPVTVEELKETIDGPLKKIRYIESIVTLVATSV